MKLYKISWKGTGQIESKVATSTYILNPYDKTVRRK